MIVTSKVLQLRKNSMSDFFEGMTFLELEEFFEAFWDEHPEEAAVLAEYIQSKRQ